MLKNCFYFNILSAIRDTFLKGEYSMDAIGYCSQSKNRPRLLDEVRRIIQLKHYSIRTEQAYVHWIRRFILFHRKRHPREMGPSEVEAFLSHLAVKDNVAASTQNQALNALVFLYREVLKKELDWMNNIVRAKRHSRLPVVLLTRKEVQSVLSRLDGIKWLMASLPKRKICWAG
jgi:hypothetical protein